MRLFISKIYLPLFFACAYKFLAFFITACLIFPPMAIFGLAFYVFVFLFELIMYRAVDISPDEKSSKQNLILFIFLLVEIIFFMAFWLGISWMQDLLIQTTQFSPKIFITVKYILDALAIILSFSVYIFKIYIFKKEITIIHPTRKATE